ncbi:MAG: hypothetical protein GYB67_14215 [Chloroflexi bacterium]|nr:hypothetical protein [Chloroflexota bacterium]
MQQADIHALMQMNNMLMGQLMMQQQLITMQQQLINSQQQVIELQRRIDAMTPKNAPDEELLWHLASGGIMSSEAANSLDPALVRKFQDWLVHFAEKHIKPYVNQKVYMECLSQMTRGLPERIAKLETKAWFEGQDTDGNNLRRVDFR